MKRKIIFTLPVLLIAAGVILNQFSCKKNPEGGTLFGNSQQSPLKSDASSTKAFEIQGSFAKIFELNKDRVVYITTEQFVKVRNPFFDDPIMREFFGDQRGGNSQRVQKRTGLGTGFVLSEDGYICTNHHVIAGVDNVNININGKNYKAVIVGSDERTDIGLLKINSGDKFKPVYFGDSDLVKVGDWAIAIGNPFGLDKTFTVGVISATARQDVDFAGASHLQTDASINPGNSGGPLINIYGEVIGINRMIYSKSGGYMGIGFAIPINSARNILEQLKKNKSVKRGYIGVSLNGEYNLSAPERAEAGAFVQEVLPDSPAAKGGLQPGDIITKIDGSTVKNFRDLINTVSQKPIGSKVKLTVTRGGKEINLFLTIEDRP